MFEFEIKKMKVGLSFSFFALIAVVTVWDASWGFKVITALFCCIIHELGHITAMCVFGVKPEKIVLYGGGIKLTSCKGKMISTRQNVIVLVAGCAVNLSVAVLTLIITGELGYFASANLFLGIFNMMPFKYFDGGRIMSEVFCDGKICDFIKCFFIVILATILCMMIMSGNVSVSLIVTFVYIVLSEILS